MSREVRRVPLDWKHPVEPRNHPAYRAHLRPVPRLHGSDERFVGLYGYNFKEKHEEWKEEKRQWEDGTHHMLIFCLEYYSKDGFVDHTGTRLAPKKMDVYNQYGEIIDHIFPTTIEEVQNAYPSFSQYSSEPLIEYYMPEFPEDIPLGYCLYETVSEGTPVTPVFATPNALIDWLATKGEDYDQVPLRRASAEAIVRQGYSVGSMMVTGGVLYDSTKDADKLEEMHHPKIAETE